MKRREVLKSCLAAGVGVSLGPARIAGALGSGVSGIGEDRASWVAMLDKVARPVLGGLSERQLKASMPVEAFAGREQDRRKCTYLEAVGRALAGIAPWLEHGARSGAEGELRERYCAMARRAIAAGVDKGSPDYLDFGGDRQTIVDAAFLALAVVRAPRELRDKLPVEVRKQLADGLRATRGLLAGFNNWLLFAAMIEACLFALGEDWDRMRVDYALREHQSWYLGDGTYGDGPHFHWDYYNSFVIQPFLLNLMDVVGAQEPGWIAMREGIVAHAKRYAAIQERIIAPDGTYPVVGRSIAYRCGAFQLLGEMALREMLPEGVVPAQVRGAMTAVIQRTLGAAGTFDDKGWLRIGLAGHQPSLGEPYISTGSLYLCTAAFLPLGLPAESSFWSGATAPWTSVKVWHGGDLMADHASDG
jgi:hypothetical protein